MIAHAKVTVQLVIPVDIPVNSVELAEWAPGQDVTASLLHEFIESDGAASVVDLVTKKLADEHQILASRIEDVEIATIENWSVSS